MIQHPRGQARPPQVPGAFLHKDRGMKFSSHFVRSINPVAVGAYVVPPADFARIIAEPGNVSRSLLPAIITAAAGRLQ